MQLFLDTSAFLSFYRLTEENLRALEKLIHLARKGEIAILLTQQVKDELLRNRIAGARESHNTLKAISTSADLPAYARDYEEAKEIVKHFKAIKELKKSLDAKIREDIYNSNLNADSLIEYFYSHCSYIERTPEIIESAKIRSFVGNPPRKKGEKLNGDAINWESLLQCAENGNIIVLSSDGDYTELKGHNKEYIPNQFLSKEWRERKRGELKVYKTFGELFKNHFPNITLHYNSETIISEFIQQFEFLINGDPRHPNYDTIQTQETIRTRLNAIPPEGKSIKSWEIDSINTYGFRLTKTKVVADIVYWKAERDLHIRLLYFFHDETWAQASLNATGHVTGMHFYSPETYPLGHSSETHFIGQGGDEEIHLPSPCVVELMV